MRFDLRLLDLETPPAQVQRPQRTPPRATPAQAPSCDGLSSRSSCRTVHGAEVIGGRFAIERLAGEGGMGTVYRARDLEADRPVALKRITEADPNALQRFEQEARTLAGLVHPHVVGYVTHGLDPEGAPYLVMEWLEGESLAARLDRGPLGLAETLALAERVAGALAAAHARGIVHRDIKPANLFIVDGAVERVKVIDFGIARVRADLSKARLTRTGTIVGTPGYMAPEQVEGRARSVDACADVFSLGAVLFECLTGQPAFQAAHLLAVLAKLLLEGAPRVREVCPDVPSGLDELIARMLAKDPAGRPADGAAVVAELAVLDKRQGLAGDEPRPAEKALTAHERRVVSIVAALPPRGVQGAEPDAVTVVLDPARSTPPRLRAEILELGARIDELADGTLLLSLIGEGAATDRAARAARCALRIQEMLPGAHIALATGRAEHRGKLPVGAVVERAAELLEEMGLTGGRPSGVRIDETTHALLGARFELDAGGRLLRSEREIDDVARPLLGKPTPCVGRDRELLRLEDLVAEGFEESSSRAALVVGEAGMGKSRVRHELVARQRAARPDVVVLIGRADSIGAGSPLSLLGSAVRSAMAESALEGRAQLVELVQKYLSGPEAQRVAEFVGETLGLSFPDEASPRLRAARQNAPLMADQIRRAYLDLLAAMTRAHPTLLVLEDLHWGDAASVTLVDAALRELSGRPFVVLALARPEVRELFPRLWSGRSLCEMRLGGLPRRAAERLVRHALGDTTPAEVVRRLVEQAQGNAFYLEELVRAVSAGREGALPDTVLGMVEARMAALDPETRRALRAASVFGETFWKEGVVALLGDDAMAASIDARITTLLEQEIVERTRESRIARQEELAFRHVLLREGAYAMLTERDRAVGHRLAAEWLLARGEGDAKVVAAHFERGEEPARAAHFYARASDQALSGGDLEAAVALAERALALGPGEDDAADLLAIQTEALAHRGAYVDACEIGLAAIARAAPGSKSHGRALGGVLNAVTITGRHELLPGLLDALLGAEPRPDAVAAYCWALWNAVYRLMLAGRRQVAERCIERLAQVARVAGGPAEQGPAIRAWVAQSRAMWARYIERDPWTALENDRAALADIELAGDRRNAPLLELYVGLDLCQLGDYERSEEEISRGMAKAPPESNAALFGAYFYIVLAQQRGALEEALALSTSLHETSAARGEAAMVATARILRGDARTRLGDLAGADEDFAAAAPYAANVPILGLARATLLASVRLAQGRAEEAVSLVEWALALGNTLGLHHYFWHARLMLVHAEALLVLERVPAARAVLQAAREDIEGRAAKIPNPALRRSFLERIEDHARVLALAKRYLEEQGPPSSR
ncbi:Adenylate cyclase [Minicystis rosea]|nr:Adenylate cyclase [Minicystis rosea]